MLIHPPKLFHGSVVPLASSFSAGADDKADSVKRVLESVLEPVAQLHYPAVGLVLDSLQEPLAVFPLGPAGVPVVGVEAVVRKQVIQDAAGELLRLGVITFR